MKQVTWTITENMPLTPDTYRLRLTGDTEAITAPGQFVNHVSFRCPSWGTHQQRRYI